MPLAIQAISIYILQSIFYFESAFRNGSLFGVSLQRIMINITGTDYHLLI